MYTDTVKCYSSSLVFHWLDLGREKLGPGLALSCCMKYGEWWGGVLELGPGALPLLENILRESSWPWPRLLGSNNLHERRDVRTQEA